MDDLPGINLSKEQKSLLELVIHAYEWPEQKFKKKYNQQIKNLDFTEICDLINEHILMCITTVHDQRTLRKLFAGLDRILYIQVEYINNDSKQILARFTTELASARRKRSPKAQGKGKSRKPKGKEEYDDSSVILLFEKEEDDDIDLAKVFENDKNVKDENLIEEIEEPDEDKKIFEASYFGPASKDELLFSWDNVKPISSLIKTTDQGKYGSFARAEKRVLEELEQHPTNTPPGIVTDNVRNDEGNFADFLQHMGEALPEVSLTPSKRKQRGNRDSTETPSKRNRIENEASALPDNTKNDEGNFAHFSQHIEEALPEIPQTPSKRKQKDNRDSIETPSKRSRRNLNEQLKASQAETSDDVWILPEIEKSEHILKKNKKKKKTKPLFDEETMIKHDLTNIYTQTVSLHKRIIQPRNIVIPAVELLKIPSSIFAKNKKRKPISGVLLEKFQLVADHTHKRNENEFEMNKSDLHSLSSVEKQNLQASDLRASDLIDNIELSSMKDKIEG
ncbi:uncharacterized protein [Chelonus insularis]|uniref:uncharacterized protein n=1 Tax=Chelonus insularis TaxID=460826 RepID=UPI00158CFA2C|nr:uncharacterized protein LOC118071481 [Chelonus insularis]